MLQDAETGLEVSELEVGAGHVSGMPRIVHSAVVMCSGDVAECGGADDVYTRPCSEYTRELLGAIPGAGLAA